MAISRLAYIWGRVLRHTALVPRPCTHCHVTCLMADTSCVVNYTTHNSPLLYCVVKYMNLPPVQRDDYLISFKMCQWHVSGCPFSKEFARFGCVILAQFCVKCVLNVICG